MFTNSEFVYVLIGFDRVTVEGSQCESRSQQFKGMCLSETNCGNVCKTEGFLSGKCTGFRRRCFCTKEC
ncbi:hypothetical protein Leryth_018745 [Lithospermum erythrorhizon]|nr:hypothetical protein Leryth_018745 [Lithospermum erythrorhizon]